MIIKELLIINPKLSVSIVAFFITLIMTLITKHTTNQNRMKELKEIQKACNIKLKDNSGNPQKMQEIQKEIMECSFELMKHSFKPLFITFIPLIIFFWWIRGIYTPILAGWLWWYIGVGVISSIVLRKILKVA